MQQQGDGQITAAADFPR